MAYGQRQHDPDAFSPYELRNGPAADREPELAYLVYAHWKEGIDDTGRSGRSPPTCPAPMDAQTPDAAGRRPHRCTPFSMQVLPAAHMRDASHTGLRWINGWVTLETIMKSLLDNELSALDDYHEKHPSEIFQKERERLREIVGQGDDD